MVTRDKVAGVTFLLVGTFLFVAAFRIDFVLRHVSFSTLLGALSIVLVVAAAYQIATASGRAERISEQMTGASPLRRLWLPARYYNTKNLSWQFRLMSIMMLAAGLMTVF